MRLKWPGINAKGNVLIDLESESFCLAEAPILVQGEHFTPKDELHVTLMGSEHGLIIQDKIQHDQTIDKLLEKTFEEIDWSYKQTGPVHILSRLEEGVVEKSIIMLIEMPGVTTFYDGLKAIGLINLEVPVPPPHVTMYTQNCPLGIGVPSDEALHILSSKTLSVNSLNDILDSEHSEMDKKLR
jgi:hypothetical protein